MTFLPIHFQRITRMKINRIFALCELVWKTEWDKLKMKLILI